MPERPIGVPTHWPCDHHSTLHGSSCLMLEQGDHPKVRLLRSAACLPDVFQQAQWQDRQRGLLAYATHSTPTPNVHLVHTHVANVALKPTCSLCRASYKSLCCMDDVEVIASFGASGCITDCTVCTAQSRLGFKFHTFLERHGVVDAGRIRRRCFLSKRRRTCRAPLPRAPIQIWSWRMRHSKTPVV